MPDGTPGPAESLALWRIAQTEGIGPMGFRRLLARHGSGAAALDALPRLLAKREAPARIPSADDARREADAMAKLGARFIFWGSAAAIVMRIVLTIVAIQLLTLPYLKLIGAVLLVYIGVDLLRGEDEGDGEGKEINGMAAAIPRANGA